MKGSFASGARVRVRDTSTPYNGKVGTVESIKPQLVRFPVLVNLDGSTTVRAFAYDELEELFDKEATP